MQKNLTQLLLVVFLLVLSFNLQAHNPDRSIVYLRIYETQNIEGAFHINVNELNSILGLSLDKNPDLEDVKKHEKKIYDYLLKTTSFKSSEGFHKIVFNGELSKIDASFGDFITFGFHIENSTDLAEHAEVVFKSFLEEDPNHINYLTIEYNWKSGLFNNEAMIALDFDKDNYTKVLSLKGTSIWKGFMAMIKQGIWHIWIGLDHILFILALILPSVVRRRKTAAYGAIDSKRNSLWGWEPVQKFRPAFLYIVKIITFFTIAHTITLSLASLKIIVLPSRLVESVIALSIGLAAYHNIRPIFKGKDWVIAFLFGLFHGFGFASVLGDLGFNGEHLTLSLLGFNIGVEIGQVAIIAGIFPILYLVRKLKFYPKFLVYLSVLLIIISLYWLVERAFDIDLPLDDYIRKEGFKLAQWLGLR